jgi:hypothetical protein
MAAGGGWRARFDAARVRHRGLIEFARDLVDGSAEQRAVEKVSSFWLDKVASFVAVDPADRLRVGAQAWR